MINVVGIKFRNAGKIYYFDPAGFDICLGDNIIVETSRGFELGEVAKEPCQVCHSEVVKPLKKIIRKATAEDVRKNEENQEKKAKALATCQEKVNDRGLEMKLIDVEYTFDNSKVIFYFTADGRVDFRELVKDLASTFRLRIELRQIGVRDEAKMLGGIGNCGRGLCCHEWLSDFHPVSIKMAKNQNLSLNPSKISGMCGRFMCCLKYENDVYVEMKKGLPHVGEKIRIPEGEAIVWESNILERKVKARLIVEPEDKKAGKDQKLSTEVYIYKKDDIERLGTGKKNKGHKGDKEDLPEELKGMSDEG